MYFNKHNVKNLTMVLLFVITTTLLIPYSSLSNTVLASNNKYEYNPSSYPSNNYSNDNYYYEDGKQYYYHYPLKDKTGDLREQVKNCKDCFFSELEKLDKSIVYKILYEIDREFGDLENLCRLIANEKIDRDTLEQILIEILTNLDYNSYYYNNNDDESLKYSNSNYDNNIEYNENKYDYDYSYNLDEQIIKQIVQKILDCLFEPIAELLVVWNDSTFGNLDIFIAKSTDGGETFGEPLNISDNPGTSGLPAIAIQGNNVYVTWHDTTFGNLDIFIAKSTDGGETFGEPLNISNNEGVSLSPQIAVYGDNVYVVWQDGTDTPGSREIFIAKSTDGSETFTTPENISNNIGFSLLPQIAVYGDNVYVVWNDDTDGFDEIFIAKSTDGGETFGEPENISQENSNNSSFAYQPSLIVNGENVYVIWHEDPLGKRTIFIAKSTDGGETFGEPLNISDRFDFSSKSAITVEGYNVFVAWIVDIPNNNDVFVAKSTDGGETFGEPLNISDNNGFSNYPNTVTTPQFEPSLIVNGENVYVAWTDGTPGNFEILLAKSTDGGETFGEPLNISNNEGFSSDPEVELLQ
jgi:hypothetical protein